MSDAVRRAALSLFLIAVVLAPVVAHPATGPTGTLTVAYATLFDENLNPLLGPAPSKVFYDVMYEYLVYNDPQTLKAEPGLADTSGRIFPMACNLTAAWTRLLTPSFRKRLVT